MKTKREIKYVISTLLCRTSCKRCASPVENFFSSPLSKYVPAGGATGSLRRMPGPKVGEEYCRVVYTVGTLGTSYAVYSLCA